MSDLKLKPNFSPHISNTAESSTPESYLADDDDGDIGGLHCPENVNGRDVWDEAVEDSSIAHDEAEGEQSTSIAVVENEGCHNCGLNGKKWRLTPGTAKPKVQRKPVGQ